MAEGWECPKCGGCYPQWVSECPHCKPNVMKKSPVDPSWPTPTGAPLIPPPFIVTCEAVDTNEGGTK